MSTFVDAYSRTHSAPQHALADTKIHRYGKWCAWLGALDSQSSLAWSGLQLLSSRRAICKQEEIHLGGGGLATYPQDTKPNEARRSHQYKPYDYRYNHYMSDTQILVLCGNKRSTKDTNISRVRNIKIVKQRLAVYNLFHVHRMSMMAVCCMPYAVCRIESISIYLVCLLHSEH